MTQIKTTINARRNNFFKVYNYERGRFTLYKNLKSNIVSKKKHL